MDLRGFLHSHFQQVIRLELLQHSFLITLLERAFENFCLLRNFQRVALKVISELVKVIKKYKVLHLSFGNCRH